MITPDVRPLAEANPGLVYHGFHRCHRKKKFEGTDAVFRTVKQSKAGVSRSWSPCSFDPDPDPDPEPDPEFDFDFDGCDHRVTNCLSGDDTGETPGCGASRLIPVVACGTSGAPSGALDDSPGQVTRARVAQSWVCVSHLLKSRRDGRKMSIMRPVILRTDPSLPSLPGLMLWCNLGSPGCHP